MKAMATLRDQLIEKINRLPPDRVEEVEDFVDFLNHREAERPLVEEWMAVSEASLSKVWDNPEDDVYNRFLTGKTE